MLRSISLLFLISAAIAAGCSQQQSPSSEKAPAANTAATAANHAAATPAGAEAKPERTPSTNLTAADIAKLKWLEGTWKGMDGDEPFFERYHFDGTTMIVEGFKDGSLKEVSDTTRFELKDGQFGATQGERRSAATEITGTMVQFVPIEGKGNSFRFERQSDGTWHAILEWTGSDNNLRQKIYIMEPYKK